MSSKAGGSRLKAKSSVAVIYLAVVAIGLGCAKSTVLPARNSHPTPPATRDEKTIEELHVNRGGHPGLATVVLSGEEIVVRQDTGQESRVNNPFGKKARIGVWEVPQPGTSHLLVTSSDDRVTYGWVLIPRDGGLLVALSLRVDEGISVVQDKVKASFRKYSDGGYHIVSEFYDYNPISEAYEKQLAGPKS